MNYQVNHIIISMGFTALSTWVVGQSLWWFVLPILFYTLREVWQWKRRVMGNKFDWQGCVPVAITQLLAYTICTI